MTIEEVLKKATKNNIPEGYCFHCKKPISNYRKGKKFCSKNCSRDHLHYKYVPPKFLSHKYMKVYLGKFVEKGQGKRCGYMTLGGMSAPVDVWSEPVPLTIENIQRSIKINPEVYLCNETTLNYEEALMLADYLKINQ